MLQETLDRHVATGALNRTPALQGVMFTATTELGRHQEEGFSLHLTIITYRDGTTTTRAEVWSGDMRVQRAPLEANWPAVKALREIAAGNTGDEVLARLLDAAL